MLEIHGKSTNKRVIWHTKCLLIGINNRILNPNNNGNPINMGHAFITIMIWVYDYIGIQLCL